MTAIFVAMLEVFHQQRRIPGIPSAEIFSHSAFHKLSSFPVGCQAPEELVEQGKAAVPQVHIQVISLYLKASMTGVFFKVQMECSKSLNLPVDFESIGCLVFQWADFRFSQFHSSTYKS